MLLTTHYLHEAEILCDRIAVLVDGEIVASDTTDALLRRVEDKELRIELASPLGAIPDELRRFNPVLANPRQLVFRYGRGSDTADQILAAISFVKLQISDLTTSQADLEEVFLDLVMPKEQRKLG